MRKKAVSGRDRAAPSSLASAANRITGTESPTSKARNRLPQQNRHKGEMPNVRFSNRPFRVKHFQTIHHYSVDVARGLVLLFGIGTKALPSWDSRTRWKQSFQAALPSDERQVQADMRTHLIHRPARDIIPPRGGARVFSYRIWFCTVFMLLLWLVLASSGTRCRQSRCGA
jgi:hypothetical protein